MAQVFFNKLSSNSETSEYVSLNVFDQTFGLPDSTGKLIIKVAHSILIGDRVLVLDNTELKIIEIKNINILNGLNEADIIILGKLRYVEIVV